MFFGSKLHHTFVCTPIFGVYRSIFQNVFKISKNSYQNLSPRLEYENCVAIIQAKVGPNIEPGNGLSDTPPDHRSTSIGCSKIVSYFCTVWLVIEPKRSWKVSAPGRPQNFLNSIYPGSPNSRPLCMLNDTRSIPKRAPTFLNRWLVTSCVMESSMAWATWFMSPMTYSSRTPALYKSYGLRMRSDSLFDARKR